MVLVQKLKYFQLFFLGKIGQRIVFYAILERKNAFLGYKKRFLKGGKIDFFKNGLTHGFGSKMVCTVALCNNRRAL